MIKEFARRFKTFRLAIKFSQVDIAGFLGVNQRFISELKAVRQTLRSNTLKSCIYRKN